MLVSWASSFDERVYSRWASCRFYVRSARFYCRREDYSAVAGARGSCPDEGSGSGIEDSPFDSLALPAYIFIVKLFNKRGCLSIVIISLIDGCFGLLSLALVLLLSERFGDCLMALWMEAVHRNRQGHIVRRPRAIDFVAAACKVAVSGCSEAC